MTANQTACATRHPIFAYTPFHYSTRLPSETSEPKHSPIGTDDNGTWEWKIIATVIFLNLCPALKMTNSLTC